MTERIGLNRCEAAAWVSRRIGASVPQRTLANWERARLLREQRPGRRVPCVYGVSDLIRAEVLGTLRRDGAPLQRIRRALRELGRFLPGMIDRPGAWRLAVTARGDVVHLERDDMVLELTRQPGQLAILDAGAIARAASEAVERHTRAA